MDFAVHSVAASPVVEHRRVGLEAFDPCLCPGASSVGVPFVLIVAASRKQSGFGEPFATKIDLPKS